MKWHVTGADARTGEDRTILIEAATEADAESVARQAGYLVSHVSEAPRAAVVASGADPLAELAAAASTAPASFAYLPPAKAHVPDRAIPVPEYWGLRFGSIAFLVFAGVFYLAGLLGLLAGIGMWVNSLGYASGFGVLAALGQFLLSLWP